MSTSTSTSEATSSSTLTGAATNPSAPNAEVKTDRTKPVCALVIGMAGSGKTTLMQCLGNVYAEKEDEVEREKAYFINLDPAVSSTEELPYFAHIDIRDTVKYKEVMKQYGLGPNGGIVTALNLFATRFDQVLGFCEKRSASNALDFIFLDTPGQIEVFTWSASGSIITESLANAFPTCILYVVDTPRNLSPVTFMSNMMYACSIMFKTKLPFMLVFNKCDVASSKTITSWMEDFDVFSDALKSDDSYVTTLTRSMSLVLEEFYSTLKHVSVSAATGEGIPELFSAIQATREQYEAVYLPLMARRRQQREELEAKNNEAKMKEMTKDVRGTAGLRRVTDAEEEAVKGPSGKKGSRKGGAVAHSSVGSAGHDDAEDEDGEEEVLKHRDLRGDDEEEENEDEDDDEQPEMNFQQFVDTMKGMQLDK